MIPTVMIPGTLCDARVFDLVRDRLPGHAAAIADITAFDDVGEAAAALLADAPARFMCVGFSLGGFVALEMLRREPERLLGTALVAGNAHPDRPEMAERRRGEVAYAGRHGMAAFVEAKRAVWGLDGLSRVYERVVEMATSLGCEVFARQVRMNIARPDLREVAATTQVPLIVIAGDDDPLCPPERYSDAAAGPAGRLIGLPGRGHYLPLEAPDEVATAIADMALAA